MKLFLRLAAGAAAAATLLCAALINCDRSKDCIRLHVIANSDEKIDQEAKLAVRDAVLELARERFTASDKREAQTQLMELGEELQLAAERVLKDRGMDYGVQLLSGEFVFPDMEYNGKLYPAGSYDALRIVLGDGEGQNWWCVMFPPLCVIDPSPEYNPNGTLRFRSFFAELWRGIFG